MVGGHCALQDYKDQSATSFAPRIGSVPAQVVDMLYAAMLQRDPQRAYKLALPVHMHHHLMHADSLEAWSRVLCVSPQSLQEVFCDA